MPSAADAQPSKADTILDAATRLFAQYGFRRTAMEDVAREAGMAKGTLYLYFTSKDAVFRAVQERLAAEILRRGAAALATKASFRERLFRLLDAHFGLTFELFGTSEHLGELKVLYNTVTGDVTRELERRYLEQLEGCFHAAAKAGEIDLKASGLSAEVLVRCLYTAAMGAKYSQESARDLQTYRRRLGDLAQLAGAAVRAKG